MSRIIRPIVSPTGRIVLLSAATFWLVGLMVLSPGSDATSGDVIPYGISENPELSLDTFVGAEGPLYQTRGLTLTPAGTLLIADQGNGRVLELDLDSQQALNVFGSLGEGPGELIKPRGPAIDREGNVFVADDVNNRISKYAPDGSFVTSTKLNGAFAVMVTSTGDVLAWPGVGTALLNRYDNDLEPAGTVLEKTSQERQVAAMEALFALDSHDRLYWLDNAALEMHVYDGRDAFREVDTWAVEAEGLREDIARRLEKSRAANPLAQLNPIMQMNLSADGTRLLMTYAHKGNGRHTVFVFTVDGRLERHFAGVGSAYAATIDTAGRLIMTDMHSLHRWAPSLLGQAAVASLSAPD